LRCSDHIKSVLQECDIPEADLEQLAADRDSWRSICATGLVWRVLQQPPIKRQVIVVLADMPLPKQFKGDLLVLNVVESALQISVFAVIYTSIKDRSDNTTTVHVIVDIDRLPQASKQARRLVKCMVTAYPISGLHFVGSCPADFRNLLGLHSTKPHH